jgi:hypothetical protein
MFSRRAGPHELGVLTEQLLERRQVAVDYSVYGPFER